MALFRRNKRSGGNADSAPDAPAAPKKEKGSWRRPASQSSIHLSRLDGIRLMSALLRHGVQAAATESLAAHSDSQDRSTYAIHRWYHICAHRRAANLGERSRTQFPWNEIISAFSNCAQVTEMTFDYTQCEKQTPSSSTTDLTWHNLTDYSYRLRASDAHAPYNPPQFAFINRSSDSSVPLAQQAQCFIQFDVPYDLEPSVLLYYKLTNYYQNHRRYVNSYDSNQLKGDYVSASTLNSGDCKPLAVTGDGKIIYPCGLIANSLYNGLSLFASSVCYS